MIRISLILSVLALSACAAGTGPSGSAPCATANAVDARGSLSDTNAYRATKGLPPLREKAVLNRIAQEQACNMAVSGILSHEGPRGEGPAGRADKAGYRYATLAENVAEGYDTAEGALGGWIGSPGHLANIENPVVSDYGIASAIGENGRVYWAAVYGKEH